MNTSVAVVHWHERLSGRAADRGSATILVIGLAIMLFACAGLAIDGGRAINARDKAFDVAEQAARTGAGQLDLASLREPNGAVVLNRADADTAARRFVSTAGYDARSVTISLTGGSVTVVTEKTFNTALLGIVGINSMTISGTATAGPATSINGVTP